MGVTIDFHGAAIPFDLIRDNAVASRYEAEEVEQALALFENRDRVVVAGAGVGWLAAVIAAQVGPRNVVCVEPIGYLARLVEQNVAVDGRPLRCLWGALTPDGESTELCVNPHNWALSNTLGGGHMRVPGRKLSSLFNAGFDCLALDVEGAEAELLDEASVMGIRKLLLEIHTFAIGEDGAAGLRVRLKDCGLQQVTSVVRDSANGKVEIDSWERP